MFFPSRISSVPQFQVEDSTRFFAQFLGHIPEKPALVASFSVFCIVLGTKTLLPMPSLPSRSLIDDSAQDIALCREFCALEPLRTPGPHCWWICQALQQER
ncbi:MAG: hypothetical protein DMG88_11655 [Acidobacteria bacterium]|nr:MAG: hypothetical protein DMG88_11655 [Acidobacteriota bacterium]